MHLAFATPPLFSCNKTHVQICSPQSCFITAEKGGVARARGEGEKETLSEESTTEGKSRRRRDEKAPGHLITGAVLRKGEGAEARSVQCMCDVCAAHGDTAAVGVDVDAQGSGFAKMRSTLP